MIISILVSIVIWGLITLLAVRTVHFSGLTFGKSVSSGIYNYACADLRRHDGSDENISAWKIFAAAFIFRIVIFLFETAVLMIFSGQEFTFATFMRRLEIWDCTNYFRIADVGYSGYQENGSFTTLAFFPLYPYTARIIGYVVRNLRVALLLTSALAYSGGCVFLYKLCRIDYGSDTAKRAVIYTSVAPFAFFFGTMMSESMLFFTSVAALYFIRKHNWPLAGVFGALAALSRMAGILVALSAGIEWLEHYKIIEKLKNKQFKEVWTLFYTKGLWIFLMLAGVGIYLLCNYVVAGGFFKFLEYQHNTWGHGPAYFGTGLANIFRASFDTSDKARMFNMYLPYLALIVLSLIMMVYSARRARTMYSVYFIAYFLINASVDYVISGCRYMVCIIPLYIAMADFAARHKKADDWIKVIFSILFGIYLVCYLHDMII